jgi:DNA-directed RNA polymerase subunit N (RpoN/RPB10)
VPANGKAKGKPRKWAEYPEVMRRVEATQKALEQLTASLPVPAQRNPKAARSPFLGAPGKRLTPHQRAFLRTVANLTAELGGPPSAGVVGEHVGLTRHGARRMLVSLEEHGLIADVPKVVRSGQWALTEQGVALLEESQD